VTPLRRQVAAVQLRRAGALWHIGRGLAAALIPQAAEALAQAAYALAGIRCPLAQGWHGLTAYLLVQGATCGLLRAAGKLT